MDCKIYTSYFARLSKIREEYPHALIVSISRHSPRWLTPWKDYIPCEELSPSKDLLWAWKCDRVGQALYRLKYLEEIKPVFQQVMVRLYRLAKSRNCDVIFLLCYEKPEDFCHRHLLAEMLGGVEEYKPGSDPVMRTPTSQMS